ncbi:HK97 family phage prohead protease [Albidovulum inexpectatum]|uniref:HK97 family phage prohead protease n=1 Tax=Albidovulum inexpectatum TaxID=196587 RepID=A0A2S5JEE9_9RHOB|nr:HK97 family phage prohead protease [Albidovulum inexpectatum]PPB79770.1 HK97 family phage prohead protease [Albidovulum inexpectatum]
MTKTKQRTATVTFAVSHESQEDGPVRFHGVAYSGNPVDQYGQTFVVDLAGVTDAEIPVLTDHDNEIDALAGKGRIFVADAEDGGKELRIEGQLSRTTEAGRQISGLLAEGFPLRMSIGFRSRFEEMTEETDVNGRRVRVDFVLRDPKIHEVSFVAVPADQFAGVREVMMCADIEPPKSDPEPQEDPERARLEAELAAATARVTELEAQIAEMRAEVRKQRLSAAFAAHGREVPDDIGPWVEMSDKAFDAALSALSEAGAKPPVDPKLFRSSAIDRATSGSNIEPSARLFQAVEALSTRNRVN